jgi:uncharacterized membrane protein YccC
MSWFRNHQAQFRLGLRITVAGIVAYGLCRLFGLRQTYQAVLTAIIVMQGSVGASLKAMLERFVGSLGGALWAVAVLFAFQHLDPIHPVAVLVVVLVPAALLAAFKPSFRAAPTTAIILLLGPSSIDGPLAPAIQRMSGVGLGSVAAIFVASLVFPTRVHETFAEAAGRALTRMSELADILIKAISGTSDPTTIQRLHDDIRKSINQSEVAADEVARARATHLTAGPDPLPMCRTMRRVLNDLTAIGRITSERLPDWLRLELAGPTQSLRSDISSFLADSGRAAAQRRFAPSFERGSRDLEQLTSAIRKLRRLGPARELPDEVVARIFGLMFHLEQLNGNLRDLVDRIGELATDKS